MSFLAILFWILIILAAIGSFWPFGGPNAPRINGAFVILLIILLGIRVFPLVLN